PKYSEKLVKIAWLFLILCIVSVFLGKVFESSIAINCAITLGIIHISGILFIIFLGVSDHRIKWWRLLAVPVFILALPGFFRISLTPIHNIAIQIAGKDGANSIFTLFIYFALSVFMWWWVPGKAMNKWMMMSIGAIPGDFDKMIDDTIKIDKS
ncbi:MAG: hypothetical protein WCO98_10320, partial [bacterium]